jgi:pyruvate/2-oxoglutarate dehydrogenase complex dihydrolipoamide acyltransferase (E2) component
VAGVVDALAAQPGDTVQLGEALLIVRQDSEADAGAPEAESETENTEPAAAKTAAPKTEQSEPTESEPQPASGVPAPDTLAGYGVSPAPKSRVHLHRPSESPSAHTARHHEVPGLEDVDIPLRGVRREIADSMTRSSAVPQATVFVDADATATMDLVHRLKAAPRFEGAKISPLLIMCAAVLRAVERNPETNATFGADAIRRHREINLGIAAATPRGLVVPNIRDAGSLGLPELARALTELISEARAGTLPPQRMRGGTVTITNVGVFGIDSGTPILNLGESAIVAMGTIHPRPWVVAGAVVPRLITTVSVTIDHRVVDGDVASRFARDIADVLEDPTVLLDR